MKLGTRRFLKSVMLKLEMQKYRKILIWQYYCMFTVIVSFFFTQFDVKLQSYKFLSNLS